MYYCVRDVKKTDKAAYCIALQTGLWSQRDFTHPVFIQILGIYGTSEVKALNYCINGVSTINTGNKNNKCLQNLSSSSSYTIGCVEVAGWTVHRTIRVRFPAYLHRVLALRWQGGIEAFVIWPSQISSFFLIFKSKLLEIVIEAVPWSIRISY